MDPVGSMRRNTAHEPVADFADQGCGSADKGGVTSGGAKVTTMSEELTLLVSILSYSASTC